MVADGDGALIAFDDTGDLISVDGSGAPLARLAIGKELGQVAIDRQARRAYVADRAGDAIVAVDLADPAKPLRQLGRWPVAAEPYGLALTADGHRLLVTSIAAQTLSALDTASGKVLWAVDIGPQPRAVAIAPQAGPSGPLALVTFINSGSVARVVVSDATPAVDWVALDSRTAAAIGGAKGGVAVQTITTAQGPVVAPRFIMTTRGPFTGIASVASTLEGSGQPGRTFVRSVFAVAILPGGKAIVGHQASMPTMETQRSLDTYGGSGGEVPAARQILSSFDVSASHPRVNTSRTVHLPRALAYDGDADVLYAAGYGDDRIVAVERAHAASAQPRFIAQVGSGDATDPCGPAAIDVRSDGHLIVFCDLIGKIRVVDTTAQHLAFEGPRLGAPRLAALAQRGREIFRRGGDPRVSVEGALACAGCHPDGLSYSLSWRIAGGNRQTPILAGRVLGTAPYQWDGKAKDLTLSLHATIKRLGGHGLSETEIAAVRAFVESLPAPRGKPAEVAAIARGKALFDSKTYGCAGCHKGGRLVDGKRHDLASDLAGVDTPSLHGLASSAPYYHDGSAATLESVLTEKGTVHGMGGLDRMEPAMVSDFIAYLESL
jgi:DNA-binding beta-propeller fold protein YncE